MNILQTDIQTQGRPRPDLTKSWMAPCWNIGDNSPRSVQVSTSTPVRSYGRGSFGRSPSSQSPPSSKPSPLSRGMQIMNLSLSSQKSGAKKSRLSTTVTSPASLSLRAGPPDQSVPAKNPRLSDLSSNSSPGSLILQLSDSSFSSHSSGLAKDESTLVEDNTG